MEQIYPLNQEKTIPPFNQEQTIPPLKARRKRAHPNLTADHVMNTGTAENVGNDVPPTDMIPDRKRTKAAAILIKDIAKFYGTVGMFVYMMDQFDGTVIMAECEKRATEVVNVAERNPEMMKFLQNLVKGSDWSALLIGHGTALFLIAQHHHVIPPLEQIPTLLGSLFNRTKKPVQNKASTSFSAEENDNVSNSEDYDIRTEIRRS